MMPKVSGKEPIHMIYSPRHIVARVTLTVRGIFYSMLRAILLHLCYDSRARARRG